MEKSVTIFISYAQEDENLLEKLEWHLSQLKLQELIKIWHRRDVNAGTEWEQTINIHNGSSIASGSKDTTVQVWSPN